MAMINWISAHIVISCHPSHGDMENDDDLDCGVKHSNPWDSDSRSAHHPWTSSKEKLRLRLAKGLNEVPKKGKGRMKHGKIATFPCVLHVCSLCPRSNEHSFTDLPVFPPLTWPKRTAPTMPPHPSTTKEATIATFIIIIVVVTNIASFIITDTPTRGWFVLALSWMVPTGHASSLDDHPTKYLRS